LQASAFNMCGYGLLGGSSGHPDKEAIPERPRSGQDIFRTSASEGLR
jgi:hypothetical protein